jgi:hypothetical protein
MKYFVDAEEIISYIESISTVNRENDRIGTADSYDQLAKNLRNVFCQISVCPFCGAEREEGGSETR